MKMNVRVVSNSTHCKLENTDPNPTHVHVRIQILTDEQTPVHSARSSLVIVQVY